jgi:hypothetical protein
MFEHYTFLTKIKIEPRKIELLFNMLPIFDNKLIEEFDGDLPGKIEQQKCLYQ